MHNGFQAKPLSPYLLFNTSKLLSFCFLLSALTSCSPTYYQKNYDFNSDFERGDLGAALNTLKQNDELANSRSRFLYFATMDLCFQF
jgi:hypothetical protein